MANSVQCDGSKYLIFVLYCLQLHCYIVFSKCDLMPCDFVLVF